MIVFKIFCVLAIAYILRHIFFQKDYTEVDVIMEEYKEMRNKKDK